MSRKFHRIVVTGDCLRADAVRGSLGDTNILTEILLGKPLTNYLVLTCVPKLCTTRG